MTRILLDLALLGAIVGMLHELRGMAAEFEDPLPTDPARPISYVTFRRIKHGMTKEAVVGLLGEPNASSIGRALPGPNWFLVEYATWNGQDCEIQVDFAGNLRAERTPEKWIVLQLESATVLRKRFFQSQTTVLDRVRGCLGLDP